MIFSTRGGQNCPWPEIRTLWENGEWLEREGLVSWRHFCQKNVAHLKSLERFMDERAPKFATSRFIRKSLPKICPRFLQRTTRQLTKFVSCFVTIHNTNLCIFAMFLTSLTRLIFKLRSNLFKVRKPLQYQNLPEGSDLVCILNLNDSSFTCCFPHQEAISHGNMLLLPFSALKKRRVEKNGSEQKPTKWQWSFARRCHLPHWVPEVRFHCSYHR